MNLQSVQDTIEATLRRHPALRDALTVVRPEPGGDKRLVAYVVPHQLQPADLQLQAQTEQVQQWQSVFDDVQTRTQPDVDPAFNIAGWNSSYTGQPIPAGEMREWRNATVERIRSLRPKRVLEIGCGTGLMLLRLAPQCSLYVGTDFSAATLAQLHRHLTDLPQVRLLERTADDLEEFEAEGLDTVLINSVSQYFPSLAYLLRVLSGAVNAVVDGGIVFIGDVRNLSLRDAFHAAVLMHRADARLSKAQFAQQLQRRIQTEKELLVDPVFFTAVLPQRLRRVKCVEVQLKHGRHHNELTQFRYDVTLHVGSRGTQTADDAAPETQWLDWQRDAVTPARLQTLLARSSSASLGITNVPNARLHPANQILTWLNSNSAVTLGDLRTSLATAPPDLCLENIGASPANETACAIDPGQLCGLIDNPHYRVSLSWSTGDPEGRFDVLLHRRGTPAPAHRRATESRPARPYANTPLQTHLQRHLVIDVRRFLQQRLPDCLIPSTFVVLHNWPMTGSGNIDRGALPLPDQPRPELNQDYVPPRNAIEEVLAALWADVLNLERVGIHDSFRDLGGHSLLATQVISRARKLFQAELPLRWILDAGTVSAFAEALVANEPHRGQIEKIAVD